MHISLQNKEKQDPLQSQWRNGVWDMEKEEGEEEEEEEDTSDDIVAQLK